MKVNYHKKVNSSELAVEQKSIFLKDSNADNSIPNLAEARDRDPSISWQVDLSQPGSAGYFSSRILFYCESSRIQPTSLHFEAIAHAEAITTKHHWLIISVRERM